MERGMTIIITMAGLGSRFRKMGYNCPKYMIEAKGKTLFEWSMDSLLGYNKYVSKYIFVVREEDHSEEFIREKCKQYNIHDINIVELKKMTDGQATTCMLAIPHCNPDSAIMVYNIDTYIAPYELKYEDLSGDGHIPCFHAIGDHWSFVKLDKTGKVTEIREKKRISDNCTIGAYYFSSARLYQELYNDGILYSNPSLEYEFGTNFAHILITGQSKYPEKVYNKFKEAVSKLKTKGFNKEEFERIRKTIYGGYIREFNDPGDIARMFLADYFKGINSFDYIEEIPIVNENYLEQILNNVFKEDKMILSVIKK